MRKNTDQKYSEYEHFSRSVYNKKNSIKKMIWAFHLLLIWYKIGRTKDLWKIFVLS